MANENPRATKSGLVRKMMVFTIGVSVGVAVVIAMVIGGSRLLSGLGLGVTSATNTSLVIDSITEQEDIILLSLGVQGITEETKNSTAFGVEVPLGARSLFLQYNYDAQLGLDGSQVKIEKDDAEKIVLTIPEFSFLGYDDPSFKVAVEDNGLLSFVTPKIDTAEVVNEILDSEAKSEHLAENDEALREQTKAFYSGIVNAVDPDIELEFNFS